MVTLPRSAKPRGWQTPGSSRQPWRRLMLLDRGERVVQAVVPTALALPFAHSNAQGTRVLPPASGSSGLPSCSTGKDLNPPFFGLPSSWYVLDSIPERAKKAVKKGRESPMVMAKRVGEREAPPGGVLSPPLRTRLLRTPVTLENRPLNSSKAFH